MATFTVNGKTVTTDKNQKLLRYLRDELRLTSVKDGCSEGACGTCTVLVDGKATKACVFTTDKMDGKTVLTVEGLSEFEKEAYTYAFGEAGSGAVRLLHPRDGHGRQGPAGPEPDPTEAEIRTALRGNICRCTGYVKIVRGVQLAAQYLREGRVPREDREWKVGSHVHRLDVAEKVQGFGLYPDDVYLEGMIYASAVRSAHPRAIVKAIHAEEALAMPGVIGVYTAEDIPGENKVGHIVKDWDTMIAVGSMTHYLGDAICIVAAETQEILEKAKRMVKVEYEILTPVRSPEEAMAFDAPLVHRGGNLLAHKHIQRGNAALAIARSKHVLTRRFSTPYTEHAFLEPECAVAFPDGDGVTIWSTDQGAYDTQHETAPMLGLPVEKVKVKNLLVGGGLRRQGGRHRPAPRRPGGLPHQAAGEGEALPEREPPHPPKAPPHGDGVRHGL